MTTFLGNDLVINESDCNLSCEYCLTGQSNLKNDHTQQLIFQAPTRDTYSKHTDLGQRINKVDTRISESFKTPFIKLTGGEIFLVKGMLDLVEEVSRTHETVVIQTNGVLIKPEHIDRLKKIDNLVIQLSLDSNLHYGNSYRVPKESLHKKVVKKIKDIIESGINTEVYAVLNDRSVADMEKFAQWLLQLNCRTVYFPFPVRGPDSDKYQIKADQFHYIENFVEKYNEFESILPPKPYFDRLLQMITKGKRTFRCHLPRLVISTFSDGVVTACPNIWFSDMGNAISSNDDGWRKTEDKIGTSGLYQALLAPKPRLEACQGCLTPWELLSLYFEDLISLDELCKSPTYAPIAIRQLLEKKKMDYLKENASVL